MFKKYRKWVKKQWENYEEHHKNKEVRQPKETPPEEPKPIKEDNGCADTICGCGCAIVIIYLICSAVGWAWGIHWLFGLLLLLFLLG